MDADKALDGAVVAFTLGTAAFAGVALVRPVALSGAEPSEGQKYYAQMYAARALPLAGGVLVNIRSQRPNRVLLAVAASAQLADSAIGFARGKPQQGLPPLLAAAAYAGRALRQNTATL